MKSKKMTRKLNLNKQTIAVIGKDEMDDIKAGCTFNFTPFITLTQFISQVLVRCPGELYKRPSVVPPCPE
ncbi:MAG: class I lanthipeptide [Acidobacteria bacterium]|jgi:hypothetical protein|nr:class I lanthipeptide [Acidobacteriota bacterium]